MPAKSFQTVPYASSIVLDADQSRNFQVTLTGSPTVKLTGGRDGDEVTVVLVQGGSGGYSPTWSNVTWKAGSKPNLNSAVGGTDLITLVKRGSAWEDKGDGAPTKLPSRLTSASLGTVVGVGLTSIFTLISSAGSGDDPGLAANPDFYQFKTGTGAAQETVGEINASGSLVIGQSGSLVVGSKDLTEANAKFLVSKTGAMKTPIGAGQAQSVRCTQTGGAFGICTRLIVATGQCVCGSL